MDPTIVSALIGAIAAILTALIAVYKDAIKSFRLEIKVPQLIILSIYLLGLLFPIALRLHDIFFSFIYRVLYSSWVLLGLKWLLDRIKTRPEFARKFHSSVEEEDFSRHPSLLHDKFLASYGKSKVVNCLAKVPNGYLSYYRLKRIEFGTWDGDNVNFLKVEFRRGSIFYDPTVFYINSSSKGDQAVKMLINQGFTYKTVSNVLLKSQTDYLVKGNLHVFLYYDLNKWLHSMIIYHCSQSDLESHLIGECYD